MNVEPSEELLTEWNNSKELKTVEIAVKLLKLITYANAM